MWFVHKPCEMMARAGRSHEFIFKRTQLRATKPSSCSLQSPGASGLCLGLPVPGDNGVPPRDPICLPAPALRATSGDLFGDVLPPLHQPRVQSK